MACEDGATARNGYRERGLATPVGDIVLRIPKLRAGTHFPEGLIERRSRADRAVAAAVAESWTNGISTRKMERIARKMGIGRLSKDQVSAMCRSLDAGVAELFSRDLGEVGFPHLFLDATYVKRRGGTAGSSPRRSSPPSASAPTGCAACSASRPSTPRPTRAGSGSCAPSPSACRAPAGSAASCTSSATSAPCWPRGATGQWPTRPRRPSSARPTPPP